MIFERRPLNSSVLGLMLALLLSCGKGESERLPSPGRPPTALRGSELDVARARVESLRGFKLERMPESRIVKNAELSGLFGRILFPGKEQEKIKKSARLYSLLGLLPANYDLKASLEKFLVKDTLAFYVPAESRMYLVSDPPQVKPEVD